MSETLIEKTNANDSSLLKANFASFESLSPWLRDLKKEAWAAFESAPLPHRKNENWRFASVQKWAHEVVGQHAAPVDLDDADLKNAIIAEYAGHLVFVDDHCVYSSGLQDDLAAKGVIFCPLKDALLRHLDLVKAHIFEREPNIGSEKYQALHKALFCNGTFVYVPKGIELDKPLLVNHWTGKESGSELYPHTLIVAEENSKVNVVDFFSSLNPDTAHFVCAAADAYAGANSHVDYRLIQDWNLNTRAFHLNSATAEQNAQLKTITVNVGGSLIRNEQHCRILGEGAHVDMYSLGVVKGEQELDQRTLQTHSAGNAFSDLLYKNVLLDKARTIFSGLIRVDENAQQTDAYQTNRNLLISPEADANSMPGLEINANDVKCSHGATISNLEEENLFYFLARGIPRPKAQELLIFGFFEEILEKFEDENLAEYVRKKLQKKFTE